MKHMKLIKIFFTFLCVFLASCSDLQPEIDTAIDGDVNWKDRDFAIGVLNEAYNQLPGFYSDEYSGGFLDCATDNAVTNDYNSSLVTMATGGWTAVSNPLNKWTTAYREIRGLNEFLEKVPSIKLSNDPAKDLLLQKRVKGEALFLRAWYQFELLSRYSGIANGKLLGFPIVLTPLNETQLVSVSRNSFDECVNQIETDINDALIYLPATQYSGADVVLGATQTGRAYKLAALALKSRLFLYAASPAYTIEKTDAEKQALWIKAALAANDAIILKGALPAINVNGSLFTTPDDSEVIWRSFQGTSNSFERANYMPSLWGSGETNPSQQLVDAFPMKNGYPITHPSSTFNPATPYANRENRFGLSIVYNTGTFNSKTVETFEGGKDAQSLTNSTTATRTGYYLRKLIDQTVQFAPGLSPSSPKHYYAFFRCGEIWLNFAEAANEAWGPSADPQSLGKTANSILGAIRKRAGIATDPYLTSVVTSGKDAFRTLTHNERRIELCFENHRFFDVRRWLLPINELNKEVEGVKIIKNSNNTFSYQYGIKVESRSFTNYMYYGPLPEQVVFASGSNIIQNSGW
jgi:hypothetical protein